MEEWAVPHECMQAKRTVFYVPTMYSFIYTCIYLSALICLYIILLLAQVLKSRMSRGTIKDMKMIDVVSTMGHYRYNRKEETEWQSFYVDKKHG